MDQNLVITKIIGVFEGALHVGFLPRRGMYRYSDAFIWFLSGSAIYRFSDGPSFTARANTLFYLPKNGVYTIEVQEPCTFICADFEFMGESLRPGCLFSDVPLALKNDFQRLSRLWQTKYDRQTAEMMELLYRIYACGLKSLAKTYDKSSLLFQRLQAYIGEHYTDPDLDLSTLAVYAGLSETHLRRLFHAKANTSPVKYITYLRLEKAKQLLANTNCSVAEIARAVGIQDPYYFSRMFQRQIGTPPSKFRE